MPKEFVDSIPYSTRSGWRNLCKQKFIGHQFREEFKQELRRVVSYKKFRHLKTVLNSVEKLYISFASFIELIRIKLHCIKGYRETVCDQIAKFSSIIPAEKIRQLFGISISTHQRWLFEIKNCCHESFTGFCFKAHPNQLSRTEIATMKRFLTDQTFSHWPVCSIALYCLREGILCCSVATWYRYRKLMNILRVRYRHCKKKIGLISTKPNEFWHLDVTKIRTSDFVWHYVYMIRDNFSKKPLAWQRATRLSMEISKEVIREAYFNAKEVIAPVNVSLIVDGGVENQNHVVDSFILSTNGEISKLTALKDIIFSNSAIEAMFRTLKSWYFRPEDLLTGQTLDTRIKFMVEDFSSLRPNAQLCGLTPDEVYFGREINLDLKTKIREAAVMRLEFNRNDGCEKCKSGN
ncbi:MAG: hypothetical protein M3R17_08430 [Bacteroidota bacterium]|nr:hypothetical protein [Bacteroidota bacterium]